MFNKQFTLKFVNIMLFSDIILHFVEGVQAFCFCYLNEKIDMKEAIYISKHLLPLTNQNIF